jgi:hypothetical protein
MSTFVTIKSACGRTTASIDIFDLELNPHGVICCNECESILGCRQAWDGMGDFLESQWSDAEDE